MGSKGVKMAQNRPKMAQSRVKIGSKWPNGHCRTESVTKYPAGAQRMPPKPAAPSKWGKGAAKAFGAVKMGVKMAQNRPKMAQSRVKIGSK